MLLNKYKVYGLKGNPFPAHVYGDSGVYIDDVVTDELKAFRERLVVGSLSEKRPMSFLWSLGEYGNDTGFGKTTMLKRIGREINVDWGKTTLVKAGVPETETKDYPICAVYGCFKAREVTNFYAGLFSAILDAANPVAEGDNTTSLIWQLRDRLFEAQGSAAEAHDSRARIAILKEALTAARRSYGIGLPSFRGDFLELLGRAEDAQGFAEALEAMVSPTARVRNGLYYFVTFVALARAAGIVRIFVFLDQLEDLANPQLSSKAKRHREVERFRDDIFEDPFLAESVSYVLTLHRRAEMALIDAWIAARLPSFSPELRSNAPKVVVLRGLRTEAAAETLVKAYLDSARDEDGLPLGPFSQDAVARLREITNGRIGEFLVRAREVLETAASEGAPAPLDAAYIDAVTTASLGDESSGSAYASRAISRDRDVADALLE